MQITLLCIAKPEQDAYAMIVEHFIKLARPFATLKEISLFPKGVARAQQQEPSLAQASYSAAFAPHLKGCTIALDPLGKSVDTLRFSELLRDQGEVNLFIGGAYGLEQSFLARCNHVLSLSPLTFSHKIAKVVAVEQLYRALTLLNHHPYHK